MKRLAYMFSISTIFIACNSASENSNLNPNQKHQNIVKDSISEVNSVFGENSTVQGVYSMEEIDFNLFYFEYEIFKTTDTLKLIPDLNIFDEQEFHNNINGFHNFFINADSTFSYHCKGYYDTLKNNMAWEVDIKNGKPHGNLKVYKHTGEVLIDRIFENGKYIKSNKDFGYFDWDFDSKKHEIRINNINNNTLDSLNTYGNAIHLLSEDWNPKSLDEIVLKKHFKNTFYLNGQPANSTIIAYSGYDYKAPVPLKYFKLSFYNGFLHDTIEVYDYYGNLKLKEVFKNGKLFNQIYVAPDDEGEAAKPIIYLYPEKEQEVNLALNFKGKFTHIYPHFNKENGWKVNVKPDGTIYDSATNLTYYALFWEGKTKYQFPNNEGFIIEGKNTREFLEEKLILLGLNRKEANEFIIYWLPKMENNKYNYVHFSTNEYEEIAQLNITPKPDWSSRIFMVFKALEEKTEVKEQILIPKKQRHGFSIVEWGGQEVKTNEIPPQRVKEISKSTKKISTTKK